MRACCSTSPARTAHGRRETVRLLCQRRRWPLVTCDVEAMLQAAPDVSDAAVRLTRECMLRRAALCLVNFQALAADDANTRRQLVIIAAALRDLPVPTFLLSDRPLATRGAFDGAAVIELSFGMPDEQRRLKLWDAVLDGSDVSVGEVDRAALAATFRLTPGGMTAALAAAQAAARWRFLDAPVVEMSDLTAACLRRR